MQIIFHNISPVHTFYPGEAYFWEDAISLPPAAEALTTRPGIGTKAAVFPAVMRPFSSFICDAHPIRGAA